MKFLDRIYNFLKVKTEKEGKAKTQDLVDTAPLSPETLETVEGDMQRGSIRTGSAQVKGDQREGNEDSLLVLTAAEIGEKQLPNFGLFCVADGAGGVGAGELASYIAIRTITQFLLKEQFLTLLEQSNGSYSSDVKDLMHRAFSRADSSVIEGAKGGVTTLTVALLHGDHITIGHVGDSRAYFIRGDNIELTTRDHSVPWRLVEIGQLTPDAAREHPQRNLLWNAVGKGSNLYVDVSTYPVPIGGHLLLCSDGLWSEIPDQELQELIHQSNDPYKVCAAMVQKANDIGGSDNITAVLVTFTPEYGHIYPS
jgi:serine/threonine protein phosphatase PrpC